MLRYSGLIANAGIVFFAGMTYLSLSHKMTLASGAVATQLEVLDKADQNRVLVPQCGTAFNDGELPKVYLYPPTYARDQRRLDVLVEYQSQLSERVQTSVVRFTTSLVALASCVSAGMMMGIVRWLVFAEGGMFRR